MNENIGRLNLPMFFLFEVLFKIDNENSDWFKNMISNWRLIMAIIFVTWLSGVGTGFR